MRILQINKFYYIKGGAERYFFEVSELLKKSGHEIAFFSIQDEQNLPSRWNEYFISNVSIDKVDMKSRLKVFGRMIYSLEAKDKISKLLDIFKPDIIHIHNINIHISPSILPEIRKRGIPIIQTVHDYHLISPNRGLFHNNHICEITKKHNYYRAIFHKCIKNSYLASTIFVITQYIHYLLRIYDHIDYFIAPSLFMKNKLIEYGLSPTKIKYLPYFIDTTKYISSKIDSKSRYVLYFGRLSPEKGIDFLIDVFRLLPDIKLKIIGTGPEERKLRDKLQRFRIKNIEMPGYLEGNKLKQYISNSYFIIYPSLWYDNMPNAILESFALSKLVVASNIGGIPELIVEGKNGLLFEPNNSLDCIKKIKLLWKKQFLVRELGNNARKMVEEKYNPFIHYKKLVNIYKKAIVQT